MRVKPSVIPAWVYFTAAAVLIGLLTVRTALKIWPRQPSIATSREGVHTSNAAISFKVEGAETGTNNVYIDTTSITPSVAGMPCKPVPFGETGILWDCNVKREVP